MLKATSIGLSFRAAVKGFQAACRRVRADQQLRPPQFEETEWLIKYLQDEGLKPVIIGSSAVIAHLGIPEDRIEQDFRTTKDLDVVVRGRIPEPPAGWRRDYDSPGVVSWISPSGGYVDFLKPGMEFPGGQRVPALSTAPESATLPVADLQSIFKMKLASFRETDISDLLMLARRGGVPTLSGLSRLQKENLEYLQLILANESN